VPYSRQYRWTGLAACALWILWLAATGCVEPVDPDDDAADDDGGDDDTGDDDTGDDDTGDDDTVVDPCDDFALLADEVDPARLLDTMTWLTSYARRDSWAVQEEILDLLAGDLEAAGAAVHYHAYPYAQNTHHNLVATIPAGADPSPGTPHLVIGAHVDSASEAPQYDAPGADDNASGVAAVLETATLLAACELPTRIDFVFFTNEEVGTVGSYAYAGDAHDNQEAIVGMIAADMLAYGTAGEDLDLATKPSMTWLPAAYAEASDLYTGIETVTVLDDHCG